MTKLTEHSLKANCKRGYSLLEHTQKELTATQDWIIARCLKNPDKDEGIHELEEFLTTFHIHIKILVMTELKPYTNKKGKTSMKHYTANGKMINSIKSEVPVPIPTWCEVIDEAIVKNMNGEWKSREEQTIFAVPIRV